MLVAGTVFSASAQLASGPVTQAPSSSSSQSTGGSSTPAAPAPNSSPYQGSVPGKLEPGVLPISLQDAINRGLKTNLGLLLSSQDVQAARGEHWKKLSALLPNVTTTSYVDGSQVDLAEFGFSFKFPGVTIPTLVGPFGYYDARAYVTQSVLDLNAINKKRAANQDLKAAQYTAKDARDLVVLAVGYNYLLAIADIRVSRASRRRSTPRKRCTTRLPIRCKPEHPRLSTGCVHKWN